MTADPSRSPSRAPAWFVVTAQGVILVGPFARRDTADVAYDDVVTRLRRDMERSGRPEHEIATQVAAVTVAHGVTEGPWGGFVKVEEA